MALMSGCRRVAILNRTSRVTTQVYCYEDSKLLKLFATVVRILYDFDVLGEDTIKAWYKKGTQPKVRAAGAFR